MRPNQNHFQYTNDLNELNQIQPLQRGIKIPVEIVHSKLDFNLSKKIKMSERVNKIFDINWTVQPVQSQINLAANRMWMSSKLCAEITYTKGNDTQLHLQTIYLPWKTTAAFEYLSAPILPLSDQKSQYEFLDQHNEIETITHYEQTIFNNESPLLDLISTKVVTSQTISKSDTYTYLILDLNCEIEYRILQHQIIQY